MIFADKNICDGQWKNDIPHGEGTFLFEDGSKYVGNFNNGKYNGHGIEYNADGPLIDRHIYDTDGKKEN